MNNYTDTMGGVTVIPALREQRRYEIARDILASSYAWNKYYRSMELKDMVAEAVEAADALIDELKNTKQ